MAITTPPRGIRGRDLNKEQRHLLHRPVALCTGRAPEFLADAYDAHYASDTVLDRVHFGWAGSTDPGEPHYYRVQDRAS